MPADVSSVDSQWDGISGSFVYFRWTNGGRVVFDGFKRPYNGPLVLALKECYYSKHDQIDRMRSLKV